MNKRIKVAQCGLGFTGRSIARAMLAKELVECVGAADKYVGVGKDLGEVVEAGRNTGVIISDDFEMVLRESKPDVWIEATASYIREIYPRVIAALEAGANVITLAEEFTDPWVYEPELASKIDEIAKQHGVSIVGTGFNPGLWMDIWPFFLTGYMSEVKKITINYMSDFSPYGRSPTVVQNYGFGLSPEKVAQKIKDGSIKLSIGTKGLVYKLARSLGMDLTEIREEMRPLVSKVLLDFSPVVTIKPGQVYGGSVDVHGTTDTGLKIEIHKQFCCRPSLEMEGFGNEPHTEATIRLEGEPNIKATLALKSEKGWSTTAPRLVNWIPHIVKAKPGLLIDMNDFPLIGAIR